MRELCHIYLGEDATSFDFYNNVLPQLHNFFRQNSGRELVLDFSEVSFISPLVVPNIFTIGYILKKHFGTPVELIVPWKPKLLSYLNDISFFSIISDYDLFVIDDRYVGGLNTNTVYPGCFCYCFEPDMAYEDVRYKLKKSINIITDLATSITGVKSDGSDLLNNLTELCYNACLHSDNLAFATIQTNLTDNNRHKKAYLAISDCGNGLYHSLSKKYRANEASPVTVSTDEFLSLSEDVRNVYAILESILFRQQYEVFGIFHVVGNVTATGGVVRIHSNDTQVILTQNSFQRYIDHPVKLAKTLKDKLVQVQREDIELRFSPVRKSSGKLKGVHIEIEVPIGVKR